MTDFPIRKDYKWVWDYVSGNCDEVEFISDAAYAQRLRTENYLWYSSRLLRLGWRALRQAQLGGYDLIMAWEGKSGFPLALLRQIFGNKYPPLAILAFSIRGPLKRFPWLQRYGVRGADYFSVPSQAERSYYARYLHLSLERIRHLPIGTHDIYGGQFGKEPGDYIFSGGRSGRDYATLLQAVPGLDIPLVVNARPFNLRRLTIPANVQVNDLLPYDHYRDQNWNARFVVVPLHAVDEAVGLTAILNAMAAGKAVLCTDLPGPAEYVRPDETGLLVPEGDVAALRDAIIYLWDRPELCREMGCRARALYAEHYTFSAFSRRVVSYLHEIAGA